MNEYIVEIDGRRVGRLRSGASSEHQVPSGNHEIRVRLDTIMARTVGYAGSPVYDADLRDGESLELDVINLPGASSQRFGVQQMTDDPEGWLMLAPTGGDKPPSSRRTFTRGDWFRYMLGVVLAASLIATSFVFRTGSPAWWISDAAVLVTGGTLVYLRFGGRRSS